MQYSCKVKIFDEDRAAAEWKDTAKAIRKKRRAGRFL